MAKQMVSAMIHGKAQDNHRLRTWGLFLRPLVAGGLRQTGSRTGREAAMVKTVPHSIAGSRAVSAMVDLLAASPSVCVAVRIDAWNPQLEVQPTQSGHCAGRMMPNCSAA
jgi:hypothetical protein